MKLGHVRDGENSWLVGPTSSPGVVDEAGSVSKHAGLGPEVRLEAAGGRLAGVIAAQWIVSTS